MIELSQFKTTRISDKCDIEAINSHVIVEAGSHQHSESNWPLPAIRNQNRCFGFAVTLLLLGAAVYVVALNYSQPGQYEVAGEYNSQYGAVSDQANNAKTEEALENNQSAQGGARSPSDHFHGDSKIPWQHFHQGEHGRVPPLNGDNRTAIKWAAQEERWNRTHPGQPYPYKHGSGHFNRTGFKGNHGGRPNHPGKGGHWGDRPSGMGPDKSHTDGNHGMDSHASTPIVDPPTEAPMQTTSVPSKATPAPSKATAAPSKATPAPSKATPAPSKAMLAPVEVTPTTNGGQKDYSAWHAATVKLSDGIKYEILETIPHDGASFTQGLTFNNGTLYESRGLFQSSSVRILNPITGEVTKEVMIPGSEFGEGMTYYDGHLVQITWKSKNGHVYSAIDLGKELDFTYTTTKFNEGWGITHDTERNELIVTDGSNNLVIWEPTCWKTGACTPIRTISCFRQNGSPATNLNEIEFWRGRVLANVWYQDVLLVIHPETGVVEKEYDMSQLWPAAMRNAGADVFNGISISDDPDVLYVTGKQWAKMFRIKLLI